MSRKIGWAKVSWLMRAAMSRGAGRHALGSSSGLSLTISVSATGLSAGDGQQVRVGPEAAVPVGLAVDRHGVVDGRQAGGREDGLHRDLATPEQTRPSAW